MAPSTSADASVNRPATGLFRRALPFAWQGALVAALMITMPPTGAMYEAEATLEIKTAEPQAGTPSPAQMVEEYVLQLVAETGRAPDATVGCAGSEEALRGSVHRLGERKLRVICRADAAQVALRQCDSVVKQTRTHFSAFEVAGRAKNLGRSLGSRLIALAIGLALGLGWVFLRVELRAAAERRKHPPRPSGSHGRISSPRPMVPPLARRSRTEIESARTDTNLRAEPSFTMHSPPSAAGAFSPPSQLPRRERPKSGLDRTIMGTGPSASAFQAMMPPPSAAAVPRVIDTTAEPASVPPPAPEAAGRSTRPGHGEGQSQSRSERPGPAQGGSDRPGGNTTTGERPSFRPGQDNMLAPYETTSRWSPDPALSAASTRTELRTLCDQLYMLAAKGCFVVRVSSDQPSASLKSHIAAQLAWSLADFGHARVLLLEADFDDPGVHRVMRLDTPAFKGFSQQLYARITSGERAPWSVARCAPCLSVLPEGRIRTPGLVHTSQFSTALSELRRYYDIIVVDGPAAHSATDTRALDGVADGIVFAVTAGTAASNGLRIAQELFGDKSLLWIVHTHPTARSSRS